MKTWVVEQKHVLVANEDDAGWDQHEDSEERVEVAVVEGVYVESVNSESWKRAGKG